MASQPVNHADPGVSAKKDSTQKDDSRRTAEAEREPEAAPEQQMIDLCAKKTEENGHEQY